MPHPNLRQDSDARQQSVLENQPQGCSVGGVENHNSANPDEPVWCMECERCYKFGEHRTIEGQLLPDDVTPAQFCPYDGCEGSVSLDAYPWSWLKEKHPEYPDIPRRGHVYRLDSNPEE
jgi:hypothetical protein